MRSILATTLAAAAFLVASPQPAAASYSKYLDLGHKTSYTPYDRYMGPVRRVLNHLENDQVSMQQVRQLMREGRSFRYSFTEPYVATLPHVTAAQRAGDCKAKSLWLIHQINDDSVRYVIGKARRTSRISHAWVIWKYNDRWWILDCTNLRDPIPADRVPADRYIPHYSYDRNGTYRHEATALMFADGRSQRQTPVASYRLTSRR